MGLFSRKPAPAPAPNHWDVISLLMQIDPPPGLGDTWLAGMCDGVYMAQCSLKGRAQGLAASGDYEAAVVVAQCAVYLNAQRRHDIPDEIEEQS